MTLPNPHQRADRVGLALARATAAKIRANPSLIDVARDNLEKWRSAQGGQLPAPLEEWERILRFLTASEVADFITSRTPKADRLRQSDPFPGVLTEQEREQVLQNA
jgi:hypothetical protein